MRVGLTAILLIAALFRFNGLEWDDGRHLHPDERFLTSVTNDLDWPDTFASYFDPKASSLSPYSLPNMGLYVYGTVPVYLVKWAAVQLDRNTYDAIPLVGRVLSALFDLASILLLFLIGRRLYGEKVGLLAAALLSLSVLNIQLSHFYTVDTFTNFFVVAAFYFLLRASASGRWGLYALTGLLLGLGLASKISIFTLGVPILMAAGIDFYERFRQSDSFTAALEPVLVRLLTVFFLAALTFRLVQPIAFSGPDFWNWSLNPEWKGDVDEQGRILAGDADLPWLQQWTGRSSFYALYNLIVWGLGIPLGLAALSGIGLAGYELGRRGKRAHLLPLTYVLVTFAYHALIFVKFMRYFLPIYPFLALFAAYFLVSLIRWSDSGQSLMGEASHLVARGSRWAHQVLARARHLSRIIPAIVLLGTLLHAVAFSAIYSRPHSRVEASRWMYANIPAGSTLANEHWDDWLPLGGVDGKTAYGGNGLFRSVELTNYHADTPQKLDELVAKLSQADYLILSSNRLSDSITRLPIRYPLMGRYYEMLFDGELGFERIAEFTSYPSILGLQIPDQMAEESFTVYDHPRVQLFKKDDNFDANFVRQELGRGIDWQSVQQLTPRQASAAPSGLRLSPAEQQLYERVSAWSSALVWEGSWGMHVPLLAWTVVILLIGLLATPLTLVAFHRLADGGYILGKALGLLVVAWGAWIIASVRLAPFTLPVMLVVLVLLALASAFVWRAKRTTLASFIKSRWRLLLIEEGLFWGFFALLLFVRWLNPDLWHPGMGGEKPMDLAYLTATIRTPYFPPYDPWFSGGYVNYYYFGFVLVAVLSHLTGIVPAVAYNLAVATFFAMTAMGAFVVALNLAEGWHNRKGPGLQRGQGLARGALLGGISGALFVAIIGNLGQVQLVFDGIRKLSAIQVDGSPSLPVRLAQFVVGMGKWLEGQPLGFRTEWWYWNATRVIPPGKGEAGPINEMPFFTFLFGDLHAHMMAMPFTLLTVAIIVNLLRRSRRPSPDEDGDGWGNGLDLLSLVLLGLTIGALRVINTWDFPTYLAVAMAGLGIQALARRGRLDLTVVWDTAWRAGLVLLVGHVFFWPFHQAYASDYFGAALWNGSRTPLWAYVAVHGFFLFMVASYLAAETFGGRGHNLLVRMLRFSLVHWRQPRRVRRLFSRVGDRNPGVRDAAYLSLTALPLLIMAFVVHPVAGVILGLVAFSLLLLASRTEPRRQFVLVLVILGLTLTLVVEFVVLKGDISRMNTVFKLYLQVWVLWAVAAAAVLPQLAGRLRSIAVARRKMWGGWNPRDWWVAFVLLFAACLVYPLTAAPVRVTDRFEGSTSQTLDGSAYMYTSTYADQEQRFSLSGDRQAITWLNQNVRGMPVILEANTPIYRWGSRISIYTGLPTVIGWDWHQKQQRSILPGDLVDRRVADVRALYTTGDREQIVRLLDRYAIRYIYAGPLEQVYYGANLWQRLDRREGDLWRQVYQNEQVKIYEVRS